MKNTTNSKRSNVLILMALFGVMVVMYPRAARAQQDVDPTWYNPWASDAPVVAHVVAHANHETASKATQAQTAHTSVTTKRDSEGKADAWLNTENRETARDNNESQAVVNPSR